MKNKNKQAELEVLCRKILRLEKIWRDTDERPEKSRVEMCMAIINARIQLSEFWNDLKPQAAQNWAMRIEILDRVYSDILQLDWLKIRR